MTTNSNAAFSEVVSDAFSNVLAKQPAIQRRKDSINGAAGTVLQLANILVTLNIGLPLWVTAIFAIIIGVVQVVFTATTEGAVTPSQERKLLEEVKKIDKPDLKHAGALNTLLNIFDAVEIERAKERGASNYGKSALSEERVPEKAEGDMTVQPEPETVLDNLRNKVADNVGK